MADMYDVTDIIYMNILPACDGFIVYKDTSADGERKDHVTIRPMTANDGDYVNKVHVNINVFVRKESNGMQRRPIMMRVSRSIKDKLRMMSIPAGLYWNSRTVWSEPLGEAKEGFDCMNIRFEVITEID